MVTLEEMKRHVRVMEHEDHFDEELGFAIEAAYDHLRSIDVDVQADPFPPALKQAVLMLGAHFFENKEGVIVGEDAKASVIPFGISRLIAPYRSMQL